jgi:hypothetical protein
VDTVCGYDGAALGLLLPVQRLDDEKLHALQPVGLTDATVFR